MPPTVPTREQLAGMTDHQIGALLEPGKLCLVPGVETEIALRVWCRDRGITRQQLQDHLDGRKKLSLPRGGRRD